MLGIKKCEIFIIVTRMVVHKKTIPVQHRYFPHKLVTLLLDLIGEKPSALKGSNSNLCVLHIRRFDFLRTFLVDYTEFVHKMDDMILWWKEYSSII